MRPSASPLLHQNPPPQTPSMANSSTRRTNKRKSPASTPPTTTVTRSALAKHQARPDPTAEVEAKPEDAKIPKLKEDEVKAEPDVEVEEEKANKRPAKKPKGGERKEAKSGGNKQGEGSPEVAPEDGILEDEDEGEEEEVVEEKVVKRAFAPQKKRKKGEGDADCRFLGEAIPRSAAEEKWPNRYKKTTGKGSRSSILQSVDADDDDDELLPAKNHYEKALVDGQLFELDDDVYVKAEDGKPNYIGRIVEFFESTDKKLYFTAQWFFRVEDTVIGQCSGEHDPNRVFYSEEKNTNVLDCIVSKITIVQVDVGNKKPLPPCDFYYDMIYSLSYTSFTNLTSECKREGSASSSSTVTSSEVATDMKEVSSSTRATLLDLYSGCGAMSTGLCIGAQLSGLKLETAWAVDLNSYACSSLKLNHPKTQVRNMNAEHYLILLKEWEKLCKKYLFIEANVDGGNDATDSSSKEEPSESGDDSDEEFEVERFLDISYGDPTNCGTVGLKLKVRWKGYDSDEDTWEPIDNLGECQERLQEFVQRGRKQNILPCPGDVDVICGGPPCQGISGFNRFRDKNNPLQDVKNRQIIVFMDIVEHLKPKYVLMENVVDLLKFSSGYLGRYAVSRLLKVNYQSRLGIMAAGCYGLPQFRGRAFLWGALSSERLPQFPLPTHHVVVRGVIPTEFERNLVAFDENQCCNLKEKLLLADAISDLPPVENDEERDEIPYDKAPATEFQKYIRLSKSAMMGDKKKAYHDELFDHRPLKLNEDDYQRVQQIPMRKGANFRDLPGLRVRPDNVVELDPAVERIYLPSKKPLVPDYALSFIKGKSTKPFGRLWWDEIVPTVVTRAEPHNQVILHPEQARVLTIRENARLQGFPDHYQLRGPVKERYIQVGNAVAVPVARALGYAFGKAYQGFEPVEPLMTLPGDYP